MALWMKKEDGTLVEVSGGGGSFEGEHVLTGDPTDPAVIDLVDEGQLLFDGVEGGSGGGGDGGPHDHDEYALVEHDHDEYLPLVGGTLTGDLIVDGKLVLDGTWDGAKLSNHPSPVREILSIGGTTGGGSQINLYGPDDESTPGHVYIYTGGVAAARFDNEQHARLYGNLQVDGYFRALGNARIDGVIHSPGTYANSDGGGANVHVTSSGYFYRSGTRGGAFAPCRDSHAATRDRNR